MHLCGCCCWNRSESSPGYFILVHTGSWRRGPGVAAHIFMSGPERGAEKLRHPTNTLAYPLLAAETRSRNATKREGLSFPSAFLPLTRAQFPRFLTFQALSQLKMAALNEGPPVWSLKPDAFEHYSESQQINIAAFPHRLFAVIKTLSQ